MSDTGSPEPLVIHNDIIHLMTGYMGKAKLSSMIKATESNSKCRGEKPDKLWIHPQTHKEGI